MDKVSIQRPLAVCLLIAMGVSLTVLRGAEVKRFLLKFDQPGEAKQWRIVNDDVMGGMSQSSFAQTPEGRAIFKGEVSLENYGGFASVRTVPLDLSLGVFLGSRSEFEVTENAIT
jgi:hypothetical protein